MRLASITCQPGLPYATPCAFACCLCNTLPSICVLPLPVALATPFPGNQYHHSCQVDGRRTATIIFVTWTAMGSHCRYMPPMTAMWAVSAPGEDLCSYRFWPVQMDCDTDLNWSIICKQNKFTNIRRPVLVINIAESPVEHCVELVSSWNHTNC